MNTTILNNGEHTEENISALRIALIREEQARYLRGEARSYSLSERKKMALDKERPDEQLKTPLPK